MGGLLAIVNLLLAAAIDWLSQSGDNVCSQPLPPLSTANTAQYNFTPDVFSTTPQMATRYKYPIQAHNLVTSDGYILTIFRIRSAKSRTSGGNTLKESPIFLQHGILQNSECFTDLAERSHAFVLANAGYDVWLGNVRGTVYSKGHVNISPRDSSFWNFNLDTLAAKDVRESLQYVANVTGKTGNITYVGHSMGTTLGFMYAAAFPEESRRTLKRLIMLSPVVYFNKNYAAAILKFVGPPLVWIWDHIIERNVVFYFETLYQEMLVRFCGIAPDTCRMFFHISYGATDRFAVKDLLLYCSHTIQAVSRDQLMHFLQFIKTGEFKKFDYGAVKNLAIYGQWTPPFYNLSQIKLPVYLFYGRTDSMSTPQDVTTIYGELGSTRKRLTQIPVNDICAPFNHIDFLFSESIEKDLYPSLFAALNGN